MSNETRVVTVDATEATGPHGIAHIERSFFFDSEAQCHVPTLTIEFGPVPVGSPNDAKGWADRNNLVAMLSSAPAPNPSADGDAGSPWRYVKIRKLDRDNWLVEISGMAAAVSSVQSHDPREMLLASLAELIAEHGPPGPAINRAQGEVEGG